VRHLINDVGNWWRPESPSEQSVLDLLEERGVAFTNLEGWHQLDQHELGLGAEQGRVRVKVVPRHEMVEISRAQVPAEL